MGLPLYLQPCHIILVSPSVNDTRALFPAGDLPTWILYPEDLPFGEGIYYLRVVPKDDLESTSDRNLTVGITTFLAHCVFWDEAQGTWDNSGCRVRAQRTGWGGLVGVSTLVQCLSSLLLQGALRTPFLCSGTPSFPSAKPIFLEKTSWL